jgi:hypothetical protein
VAASEHDFQIDRGSRTEDRIRATVNVEDEGRLRDLLHAWLESNRWDRDRWCEFTISTVNGWRRIEVRG